MLFLFQPLNFRFVSATLPATLPEEGGVFEAIQDKVSAGHHS
jgi:hypothetical protein